MASLANKTALVTGASCGIGRATALALAKAGAYVIVYYGKSQNDADMLIAEIESKGGRADALGYDLAAPDGASELATKVRGLVRDRLDIVVATAGISKAGRIEDHTVAEFDNYAPRTCEHPSFLCSSFAHCLE